MQGQRPIFGTLFWLSFMLHFLAEMLLLGFVLCPSPPDVAASFPQISIARRAQPEPSFTTLQMPITRQMNVLAQQLPAEPSQLPPRVLFGKKQLQASSLANMPRYAPLQHRFGSWCARLSRDFCHRWFL